MAKTTRDETIVDVGPDLLFSVLTDHDFKIASALNDEGTVEATVKETQRTDKALVLEVHCVEYARGLSGIDKSKTEHSVTTYAFDLERKRATWEYKSMNSWADKVKVSGTESVVPHKTGAKLVSEATFSVKIPLLGGKIESLVVKDLEKQRPAYDRTLREFCEKLR
jgi:hypothetical protein